MLLLRGFHTIVRLWSDDCFYLGNHHIMKSIRLDLASAADCMPSLGGTVTHDELLTFSYGLKVRTWLARERLISDAWSLRGTNFIG